MGMDFFLVFFGNNLARKQKKVAEVSPKNFFSKKKSKSGLVWANSVKCTFLGPDFFFRYGLGLIRFFVRHNLKKNEKKRGFGNFVLATDKPCPRCVGYKGGD